MAISKATDQAVRTRAGNRCEYCLTPQAASKLRFWIDHIIAFQHLGETTLDNLALACPFCNRHKGPNLGGIDPDTKQFVSLFNPRLHTWASHFVIANTAEIRGTTPTGRVTVIVLGMNRPEQMLVRRAIIREGLLNTTKP